MSRRSRLRTYLLAVRFVKARLADHSIHELGQELGQTCVDAFGHENLPARLDGGTVVQTDVLVAFNALNYL